jgi:hypothetical protein
MASGRGGQCVREWYRTLRGGAYALDVLSLVIGAYVAARVFPGSLWAQLAAVLAVQVVHDLEEVCDGPAGVNIMTAEGPKCCDREVFNKLWKGA